MLIVAPAANSLKDESLSKVIQCKPSRGLEEDASIPDGECSISKGKSYFPLCLVDFATSSKGIATRLNGVWTTAHDVRLIYAPGALWSTAYEGFGKVRAMLSQGLGGVSTDDARSLAVKPAWRFRALSITCNNIHGYVTAQGRDSVICPVFHGSQSPRTRSSVRD